ncbi:MAG: HipA domain-containing protein [Burkholderiaceae bacterium]|nr:HipA domain-containing protein [Burkholderiaceae bacterium]
MGFAHRFSTLGFVTKRAGAAQTLLRWAIFQCVVGNADGHGKNVSFFSRPQRLAVAPFYDIVSTVQYGELDADLGMAFGDEFELAAIGPFDWADFAHRANVPRAALRRGLTFAEGES